MLEKKIEMKLPPEMMKRHVVESGSSAAAEFKIQKEYAENVQTSIRQLKDARDALDHAILYMSEIKGDDWMKDLGRLTVATEVASDGLRPIASLGFMYLAKQNLTKLLRSS